MQFLSPLRNGYVKTALEFQRALIESQMQMQRNQFQIYTQWLRSVGAMNQDAWDQWACRFGGGVPLDG
ncbi:hypothetical protein A8M77_18635 [Variovorax sp. JS1663]|nr:hypothetical protein A8M77_18635 [Variovorax sp. JS1663]